MGNYSIGDWKEKGNKFYVSGKEVIEDVEIMCNSWNLDNRSYLRSDYEKNRTRQQDLSCMGSIYKFSLYWIRIV